MAANPLRRIGTSLWLRGLDARDRLDPSRPRDPLVPPRRLGLAFGDSDYAATGDEFLGHFTELAGLAPTDRVLDIGCGIGRMARPLAGFLGEGGSYDGFDVHDVGVAWCEEHYADRPAFRFRHADVRNAVYNPAGTADAACYRFPYDDASFDLAFATSVFTHLTAAAARHYLDEAARVLAPGGRLLATFFVLDDAARTRIAQGRSVMRWHELDEAAMVTDLAVPEQAVAYDRDWVVSAFAAAGLEEPAMHPGTWSGRPDGTSLQDILVARRLGA